MSSHYIRIDDLSIAVLDMTEYGEKGDMIITRINVPKQHRGKGYGNLILKQAMDWADENKVTLWLEINPYGEMTYEQLEAWYKRKGFKGNMIYRRKPQ